MSGEGGAIAEVLAAHEYALEMRRGSICRCGFIPTVQPETLQTQQDYHREHVADALADLLAAERQRGREEVLREAAKEAEERGDIGKDGGCEAWTWLRIRADRIADVPAAAEGERAHPEDYCHRCGGRNISWYTPGGAWDPVMRPHGESGKWSEIICPLCFVELAGGGTWALLPTKDDGERWTSADERAAIIAAEGERE